MGDTPDTDTGNIGDTQYRDIHSTVTHIIQETYTTDTQNMGDTGNIGVDTQC